MRSTKIQKTTGENLRGVISQLLVRNYFEAIKELVSNSYDADATRVDVNFNPNKRRMVIEDNGTGMTEKGLDDFLRLGDSVKVGEPISAQGRRKIGKFGIATVLLQYLANGYELQTWRDGKTISGNEDFSSKKAKGLEYVIDDRQDDLHGTRITLSDTRFSDDNFSLARLKTSLAWEMPHQQDFVVAVNGEPVERKNNEPAEVFQFSDTLPHVGLVEAKIEYFDKKPKMSGVYVYVNKRSVGGDQYFNPGKVARALVGRVFGAITADGLQEHISFDRSRFKEDNEALSEVREWVYQKLRDVRQAIRRRDTEKLDEGARSEEAVRVAVHETEDRLQRSMSKSLSSGIVGTQNGEHKGNNFFSVKRKILDASSRQQPSRINLHVIADPSSHSVASLEKGVGEVHINRSHPLFSDEAHMAPDLLKALMLVGSSYALAEERFRSQAEGGVNGHLSQRAEVFERYCRELLPTAQDDHRFRIRARASGEFTNFKLYPVGALKDYNISQVTVNKLEEAGILHARDGKYLGEEVNAYLKETMNASPALEAVREYMQTKDVTRQRVAQVYDAIDEELVPIAQHVPFIRNIGVTRPLWIVENDRIPDFLGLYAQGALTPSRNLDKHMERYGAQFAQAAGKSPTEAYLSLRGLTEAMRMDARSIFELMGAAQERGFHLRTKSQDGVQLYVLEDVKRAREKYVGGHENGSAAK